MKKIKLIRSTFIAGEFHKSGWTGDVERKEAVYLMRIGKAVPYEKQTKTTKGGGDNVKGL